MGEAILSAGGNSLDIKHKHNTIRELKQRERQERIALDWQNNNSARASRFLVHFFVVTARLRRERKTKAFVFFS